MEKKGKRSARSSLEEKRKGQDAKRYGKVMTRRDGKWDEVTCKGFALSGKERQRKRGAVSGTGRNRKGIASI